MIFGPSFKILFGSPIGYDYVLVALQGSKTSVRMKPGDIAMDSGSHPFATGILLETTKTIDLRTMADYLSVVRGLATRNLYSLQTRGLMARLLPGCGQVHREYDRHVNGKVQTGTLHDGRTLRERLLGMPSKDPTEGCQMRGLGLVKSCMPWVLGSSRVHPVMSMFATPVTIREARRN